MCAWTFNKQAYQQCQNSIYVTVFQHSAYAACSSSCISASGWPTAWKCESSDHSSLLRSCHRGCGLGMKQGVSRYFYPKQDVSSCNLTLCHYETYIVTRFITHRMIFHCHPTFHQLHTSSGWQHPHWAHTHHYSYSGPRTKVLYHCSTPRALYWGAPV